MNNAAFSQYIAGFNLSMVTEMRNSSLYSIDMHLMPDKDATIPVAGHQIHASFLDLVGQIDPSLSARLHDEPGHRPYTLSPLSGGVIMGEHITFRKGQTCYMRITLLDGGALFTLLKYFFMAGPVLIHLGGNDFRLIKMHITPGTNLLRLAGSTDWQTLLSIPAQSTITMYFCTATAFSLGSHEYCLFPEPSLVFGGLLRVWNKYAPEQMSKEKQIVQASSLSKHIAVTSCRLRHAFLHFSSYVQKGFVGQCTYQLQADQDLASHLTTLAAFAYYAGAGYKTTMGMGQVRVEFCNRQPG